MSDERIPNEADPTSRRGARGDLSRIVSRIRVRDAIIFHSPTVIGMALQIPGAEGTHLLRAALLATGSFLIMAHIFALNDWGDMSLDYQNQDKRSRSLVELGITSKQILGLALVLAVLGLGAVALVSAALLPIAGMMILLGVAYSFPIAGLKAKGLPIVSSALHFAGTLLTYLLGSAAFAPVDYPAVLVGSYFGILIVAGHLAQEVQDYTEDRRAGIRTNAVQFGKPIAFWLSFGLFGLSFVVLTWLSATGVVPSIAGFSSILFPLYAYWAVQAMRAGLPSSLVRQLRNRYRILFAAVALMLLLGALAEKLG